MFIHDLKPLDILNYLLKYADDASLLCPQNSSTSIELEMAHVIAWARENKMSVNLLKTVELVFRRSNISNDLLPSVMTNVRRGCSQAVKCTSHTESYFQHIDAVVTVCNQRLYLLAQLKRHGLDLSALDSVFNAIIANKILYALPVYYGYLTQGHKEMLERIFKTNRRGFTVREYDLEALAENAQYDLFHNSCSTDHCLTV